MAYEEKSKVKIIVAIISAVAVVAGAFIGGRFTGKAEGTQQVNQVNVNLDKLVEQNRELQSEKESVLAELNALKERQTAPVDAVQQTQVPTEHQTLPRSNTVYLGSLPVYSCKFFDRGDWKASDLYSWDRHESKAADGNTYKDVAYFALSGGPNGWVQIIHVEYLLEKKYQVLNFRYMLDEPSKSTATIAAMRLYDENEELLYASPTITGGMVPQEVKNLDVSNVVKIRVEFRSEEGQLGNSSDRRFGVVWIEPILTLK